MIGMSSTLFKYIGRGFLLHFSVLMLILLGMIFILDNIELMRRASSVSSVTLDHVLILAALQLPQHGEVLLPFGILFATIYTCWKLNKTHELVVLRSAGISAWQFLAPMIAAALTCGVLATAVINPISALMLEKHIQLEAKYFKKNSDLIIVSRTGIWLRQPMEDGYALLHATGLDQNGWKLSNVIILNFAADDSFKSRIDSPTTYLRNGYWEIQGGFVNEDNKAIPISTLKLPTELTIDRIKESFADPDTISFWRTPEYINIMEETGFPATQLHIHFQSLLAQPFFFAAMVLLAATFSLRPLRFGRNGLLIGLGVAVGFFVFFMESMLQAFGMSQKIPALLAAWTPTIVSLLLGMTALLHLEDG